MCGIFGFVGENGKGIPVILNGIGAMEHRGYDSMGAVFITANGGAEVIKISQEEKSDFTIRDLRKKVKDQERQCNIGLGHTRWATYGKVNNLNAHPHSDEKGKIFVVHNGNLLNFATLKKELEHHSFNSETDTEVIAHLISDVYKGSGNLEIAVKTVLTKISGANAFLVMSVEHPEFLVAANKGGTILLGRNDKSTMVASDPFAFENLGIKNYKVLGDNEIAVIRSGGWSIIEVGEEQTDEIVISADLGDFRYFMEKEIFEQPKAIANAIRGRLVLDGGLPKLGGIEEVANELRKAEKIHFIGCGTAYHACLYATLLLNRFGINARAWIASEFVCSHPIIEPRDAFVFVSQSGETADTIDALKEVQIKRNICLGIVNAEGSRIARETSAGIYIRAGKEKAVASTKAFTSQLITVVMLAVFLARQRRMTVDTGQRIIQEMFLIPDKIQTALNQADSIKQLVKRYCRFSNFYFLGRYFSSVVAREGSLKLKEVSYVHAESYPLGEMKHGPLALIDENFCSVVIIPMDSLFQQGVVNIREIKARKGIVLAITDGEIEKGLVDDIIKVPKISEYLSPLITTIPTQLFAYFMALELGYNPDKPRNIAKTVTVG